MRTQIEFNETITYHCTRITALHQFIGKVHQLTSCLRCKIKRILPCRKLPHRLRVHAAHYGRNAGKAAQHSTGVLELNWNIYHQNHLNFSNSNQIETPYYINNKQFNPPIIHGRLTKKTKSCLRKAKRKMKKKLK